MYDLNSQHYSAGYILTSKWMNYIAWISSEWPLTRFDPVLLSENSETGMKYDFLAETHKVFWKIEASLSTLTNVLLC